MIPFQQYQQMQQQPPPQPMAPMPPGGYINPQSGELLEAEQGPHIDKMAGKKSG